MNVGGVQGGSSGPCVGIVVGVGVGVSHSIVIQITGHIVSIVVNTIVVGAVFGHGIVFNHVVLRFLSPHAAGCQAQCQHTRQRKNNQTLHHFVSSFFRSHKQHRTAVRR